MHSMWRGAVRHAKGTGSKNTYRATDKGMHRQRLEIPTQGKGPVDITDEVNACVGRLVEGDAMAQIFVRHTSASLLINEGADPLVAHDLEAWMSRLVTDGDPLFQHREEGDDDMSAHVRGALTDVSLLIPVARGRLDLGTWQRVFLWEHRHGPMRRNLTISVWS